MADHEIPPELAALARRIQSLREEARALGLFAEDRGLLSCPGCGLEEDVTIGGRLITCDGNVAAGDDLGLRFVESPVGDFVCPRCGTLLAARMIWTSRVTCAGPAERGAQGCPHSAGVASLGVADGTGTSGSDLADGSSCRTVPRRRLCHRGAAHLLLRGGENSISNCLCTCSTVLKTWCGYRLGRSRRMVPRRAGVRVFRLERQKTACCEGNSSLVMISRVGRVGRPP